MIKQFVVVIALLIGGLSLNQLAAQTYSSAIGLRLGAPTSISYKTFLTGTNALEVFGGIGFVGRSVGNWFNLGVLYQVHNPLPGATGLSWYFGGGASAFFWSYNNRYVGDDGRVSLGLLGNLGLDYKIPSAPLNFSLDWVPIFFVNGYGSGFGVGYGALSIRYVLN